MAKDEKTEEAPVAMSSQTSAKMVLIAETALNILTLIMEHDRRVLKALGVDVPPIEISKRTLH